MISYNCRESAKKIIPISKNELNQLLFWACVGVGGALNGSYSDTIIETIKEYSKITAFPLYPKWKE